MFGFNALFSVLNTIKWLILLVLANRAHFNTHIQIAAGIHTHEYHLIDKRSNLSKHQ